MVLFISLCATKITHGEITAHGTDAARASDHGHPVPPRKGHGGGGHGGAAGRAELLDGAHPAACARGKGPRAPRGGGSPLRVHARGRAHSGAEVSTAPPGRHLFRRLGGKRRRRVARRGGRSPVEGRTGPHCRTRRQGAEGGEGMMLLFAAAVKVSVILLAVIAAGALLRRSSAAVRHWVYALGLACALLMPALAVVVPAWQMPALRIDERAAPEAQVSADALVTVSEAAMPAAQPAASEVSPAAPPSVTTATVVAVVWGAGTALALGVLLAGL